MLSVVTASHSKPLPEWYREYVASLEKDKKLEASGSKTGRATVNEECPKCFNPTMEYYTMQLRSADEGQTVFYDCPKCGHKFTVNT
jgi:DNA-directed RNA polymerase I subunit RPA12